MNAVYLPWNQDEQLKIDGWKISLTSWEAPNFSSGDIIAHQGVCTPNCDEGTATVTTPLECEVGWSFIAAKWPIDDKEKKKQVW